MAKKRKSGRSKKKKKAPVDSAGLYGGKELPLALHDLPQRGIDSLVALLSRPPRLTVSEWSDVHRRLSSKFSAEPGQWRTDRIPYVREIQDSFCDPNVSRITLIKSAQVGGTEVMNNCVLYSMDASPGPVLYILPTQDMVEEEMAGRLRSMVEDCPQVARHITEPRRWQTAEGIKLSTMQMYGGYAKAPATLTRRACKYVFFDELDNCAQTAGALGNHLTVAAERITTFGHRGKAMSVTTPTSIDAPAHIEWEASDKRRYNVPCPHCGAYQILRMDRIQRPQGVEDPEVIEASNCAFYECEDCCEEIHQRWQMWMVRRGLWVPEVQTIAEKLPVDDEEIVRRSALHTDERWEPEIMGDKPETRRIGFHIWSAYSPWRTWSMILAEFFRVKNDPARLRVFVNSWLGEAFKEAAEETSYDDFSLKRRDARKKDIVPREAVTICCAADVQKDHIVYVVRAWGYYGRSWLIRHGIVPSMEDFYDICSMGYAIEDTPKGEETKYMRPSVAAIDSGYRTQEVYDFAMSHPGVYAVKGVDTQAVPVRESDIEYVSPRARRTKRSRLLTVHSGHFKEALYRLAKIENDQAGAFQLNSDATDEYCRQFTSEQLIWQTVKRKSGPRRVRVWALRTSTSQNHYLDAEVYAIAIASHTGVLSLRPQEVDQRQERTQESTQKPYGQGPMGWKKMLPN